MVVGPRAAIAWRVQPSGKRRFLEGIPVIIGAQPLKVVLIVPVYDDWASLKQLLHAIDAQSGLNRVTLEAFVVNDGSLASPPPAV